VAEVRETYGLNRPVHEQYLTYVGRAASGDLGTSVITRQPVRDEIVRRFPASSTVAGTAILFAIAVGIPLGYAAARRPGSAVDNASTVGSLVGISIPVFALGYLLKYVFAVRLGWLPSSGREPATSVAEHPTGFYLLDGILTGDPGASWSALQHLLLPAIALGTIPLAFITRITRAAVLEVSNEDYVRTAEAKGLQRSVVSRRHVLRNAMLPVSTVIGLQTGLLLSGAVLTETVFAINGMGSYLAEAVFARDYAVLQGGVLFLAVIFVVVNLLVDLTYGVLDPRVRTR
jgi:peptide/nickel transport system permease protein